MPRYRLKKGVGNHIDENGRVVKAGEIIDTGANLADLFKEKFELAGEPQAPARELRRTSLGVIQSVPVGTPELHPVEQSRADAAKSEATAPAPKVITSAAEVDDDDDENEDGGAVKPKKTVSPHSKKK